jgi:predicted dehydrogenase
LKKEERLLRVGVLGCGPIAQIAHFDACRKARNAELYAICDLAPDLLARMAAIHQPTVAYDSLDAMLADPRVEAVIVATADQFHVPLAMRVIAAGKHVLIQKPMGVNVEECEALGVAVRGSGLVLQVGHNLRFDPGIAFARRFVIEELGQKLSLKAWYHDSTYRYTMTDNLQAIVESSETAHRPDGNPKADRRRYYMLGHGSHLVDLARFLGGDLTALRARLVERFGAYCWFVETDFADGSLGHLDLTIPDRGDFQDGFQISGEFGSIQGRVALPWYHKSSEVECFSTRDGQFHRPLGADAYTYKLEIEGFADRILHGAPQHGADVDDGIAAVRAMVAIARSVESGARRTLAEVSGPV